MNLSTPHISVQPPRSVCLLSMVGMAAETFFSFLKVKVLDFTTCALLFCLKMHLEKGKEKNCKFNWSIFYLACFAIVSNQNKCPSSFSILTKMKAVFCFREQIMLNNLQNISLSFLLAEIPSRKFMFFYALRNEFLRLGTEFHRFLFSQELNLPVFSKKRVSSVPD